MPQVPKHQVAAIEARTNLPPTDYAPKTPTTRIAIPGITIEVVIPYAQRRATGELTRSRSGPELTVRVNEIDKALIKEGANACGLSVADFMRQAALHMTHAIKAQNAHAEHSQATTTVPRKP